MSSVIMSETENPDEFERHAWILLKCTYNWRLHPAVVVWQHNVTQSGKDECFLNDSSSSLFCATRWSGLAQFVSSNRKASETKQQTMSVCPSDS